MNMPAPLKAKVSKIRDIGSCMKIIDLMPDASLDFVAGQFISIEITDHRSGTKTFRSYSLASVPGDSHLSLCVSHFEDPESVGFTYLRNLKEGDEVLFRGPFGKFVLDTVDDRNIVFFAGGSGIAPIQSMMLELEKMDFQHQVTLFYGVRHAESFCYLDVFKDMATRMPHVTIYPCVSDDGAEVSPGMYAGRVTNVFMDHYTSPLDATDFYLCGSPNMVEACKELLVSRGVEAEAIKMEAY